MITIASHLKQVRKSMAVHPDSGSNGTAKKTRGGRIFTPEKAALVFALRPPVEPELGKRNVLIGTVARKLSFQTGATIEAIKKIWTGESHRDAWLNAKKLPREQVAQYAATCQIDEPYLADILKTLN